MIYKILTTTVVLILIITNGCSTLEHIVYYPDINQGNYLVAKDVAKIHTGMNQQQVAYALGTPMMHDPFGSNMWYYVFRQEHSHQNITQQTLTLTFDMHGTLTNIENKAQLT